MKRSDIPELHKIPVAELPGSFSVDVQGQVWRVRPPKPRSNQSPLRPLKAMTLNEAVKALGHDRALRDKFPLQLMPGVWWMRWGGDLEPPRWLGQSSLQNYLCQHAIGARRIHPDGWPTWPEPACSAASRVESSEHKGWFVVKSHQPAPSTDYQSLRGFLGEQQRIYVPRLNHSPILLLGAVVSATIFASKCDCTERSK